jgi:hypothetical protein
MKVKTGLLALFAVATIFTATSARALIVIDFESLEAGNNAVNYVGDVYTQGAFELTNLSPGVGLGTFGALESRFTGSTALFDDIADGVLMLDQIGDAPFDLVAINLASLNGSVPVEVTFLGTIAGGGSVSQTFTVDGSPFVQQTFNFTGFSNLTKVEWIQAPPYHQFDDIVVNVVPEPDAWLLIGTGIGIAIIFRKLK